MRCGPKHCAGPAERRDGLFWPTGVLVARLCPRSPLYCGRPNNAWWWQEALPRGPCHFRDAQTRAGAAGRGRAPTSKVPQHSAKNGPNPTTWDDPSAVALGHGGTPEAGMGASKAGSTAKLRRQRRPGGGSIDGGSSVDTSSSASSTPFNQSPPPAAPRDPRDPRALGGPGPALSDFREGGLVAGWSTIGARAPLQPNVGPVESRSLASTEPPARPVFGGKIPSHPYSVVSHWLRAHFACEQVVRARESSSAPKPGSAPGPARVGASLRPRSRSRGFSAVAQPCLRMPVRVQRSVHASWKRVTPALSPFSSLE